MISRSQLQEAGFTLIELLVSLVLLALLTSVLLEGFRFAMQPLHRQAARFEDASRLPVAFGFLRTELADARPIVPINGDADTVAFDGRPSRIMFIAAAPRGAAQGGLYRFRLDVRSGQLRVRLEPFEGILPSAEESASDLVLLDGVRSVALAYYGKRWSDPAIAWHDEWWRMAYLPLLVRFEFELANGEQPPPLVIAPQLKPLRAIPVASAPPAGIPR